MSIVKPGIVKKESSLTNAAPKVGNLDKISINKSENYQKENKGKTAAKYGGNFY